MNVQAHLTEPGVSLLTCLRRKYLTATFPGNSGGPPELHQRELQMPTTRRTGTRS